MFKNLYFSRKLVHFLILSFLFSFSSPLSYGFSFIQGKLPIYFAKNDGLYGEGIKFYGIEQGIFFREDGVYFLFKGKPERNENSEILKILFQGRNKNLEIEGEEISGKVNYLIGRDISNWKRGIPTFKKIRYKDVYKGVDIVFYGGRGGLEYDILIRPGVDVSKILFEIEGFKELKETKDGGISFIFSSGKVIHQRKPYIYQEINGKRIEIDGSYRIFEKNGMKYFGFNVNSFDSRYPLIIDPTIIYSTFLGGSNFDGGYGIAVDNLGYVYVIGQTFSSNFPVSSPLKGIKSGYYDIFLTKIAPEGNSIVYSTFLGGNGDDYGYGIAVDGSGNVIITGCTESSDFPLKNPIQNKNAGGRDVFVAKINSEGNSLVYSTYLGGSGNDYSYGLALDGRGNAYITGATYSSDFPKKNSVYGYSGYFDIFLTKIDPIGNLLYSTYYGGSNNDYAYGIALDTSGNVYLTGATYSTDFPVKNPIKERGGLWDAFLVKVNSEGNEVILSSYIGGSDNDYGSGIAVDPMENVYLTGYTSSPDFPTENPIQESIAGNYDLFITKISTLKNKIVYSTFLGGGSIDYSRGIALDSKGNVYITGETYSSNFPTHNPIQKENGGSWDAFIVKVNSEGNSIVYSTYIGGNNNDYSRAVAVDSLGNAYITGYTSSNNFPTAIPIYGYSGSYDAFVAKIEEGLIKYTLTVEKAGTGNGVVKSDDGGIDCGNDCSEDYDAGIVVKLTALPDSDSSFTGWGGDCSGTDQEIEIKMDSNKKCIANFLKGSIPDLVGEWLEGKISKRISGIKVFEGIFRISNVGTADCTDEFKVSFYLSNDGKSLDSLLKTSTISSQIKLGEYKDSLFSYYFASYVSLSGKYIIGVIDLDNQVKERDKTNNRFTFGPFE